MGTNFEEFTHKGLIGSIDYIKDEDDNLGVTAIHTEYSGEGQCYKDKWDCGDVIYISENGANDFNNREETNVEFEDIAWTRESWIDWVKEELRWESEETAIWTDDEFIECIARTIYEVVEWEDLSTRLDWWLNGNDIEEFYKDWREKK